jgi:DNA helicase-2/ATP-dependent DNA helicase PcrA
MGRIYKTYANRCFKAGAMDFDDLLYQTNVLLRDFPEALQYYQHKFKYILVDEYQDTNYAQYLIVKKLAAVYENICVVGDDAQSIYSFRGANIQNILNFKKDYPDFQLFKLEQNYRSTKSIVEAANSVIARNKDQIQKDVWTDNELGKPITILKTMTDNEEGKVIANKIYDLKQGAGLAFNDFAILYRTNSRQPKWCEYVGHHFRFW